MTSCVRVAPLPVVGPKIRVFDETFNVPALPSVIVLAETGWDAAKTVGSKVMSAPDVVSPAAAASASRRLQLGPGVVQFAASRGVVEVGCNNVMRDRVEVGRYRLGALIVTVVFAVGAELTLPVQPANT